MGIMAMNVSPTFMENMKNRDRIIMMLILTTDTSCSETNMRTISTSEVQRWIMSPVWFFMCHS